MILGLDVGGTQTDAVLVDPSGVLVETKTPTREDLLETLREALDKTLAGVHPETIQRMAFSTTMATNAIVEDRLDPAGMIVSAGPGMDPVWFSLGPSYHVVEGCIDHQGLEALPLNKGSVVQAASHIFKEGIPTIGVASKFGVRNPFHELQMSQWVKGSFSHVALGHRVSGVLNFPRRITTTYLNAALYRLHHGFVTALNRILGEKGLNAPRYLLKPDGGTMDLIRTMDFPARMAQSGPAASVMGALALDGCRGTTLVLDIGGTTTDIAVVLDGIPLLEPLGIRLGPFRTLIPSLLTHSIGLGGDSEVRFGPGQTLRIGPLRRGRPAALGGPAPTPTDAMVVLGLLRIGDPEAAKKALEAVAAPLGWDIPRTSRAILETMAELINEAVRAFLHEINSRPVYTIYEVLEGEEVKPSAVVLIGGPAPQMADFVTKATGLPCRVPAHFGVANALGAALARVTSEVTLQADTYRGTVVIPEADFTQKIDRAFDLQEAMALARATLVKRAMEIGADPETLEISVSEKQAFSMIRDSRKVGQNIRLKMSVIPGLIREWRN